MHVILLEDVRALGRKGDIVDVPEGYARNFLFPQHLGVEASGKNVAKKAEKERVEKHRSQKEERREKSLATALDGEEVVITAKADSGSLYAAVGPKQVVEALKAMGHAGVDADCVEMTPMKSVGTQDITIAFPSGFEAQCTLVVESS